jgi:hypothetical protein
VHMQALERSFSQKEMCIAEFHGSVRILFQNEGNTVTMDEKIIRQYSLQIMKIIFRGYSAVFLI